MFSQSITSSTPICGKPLGLSTACTCALMGLDAQLVRVEVACTRGPAFFQMVGLPEPTVREARVRVASALARLGVLLDEYAITVNLAPAELRKRSASIDLAIAVAVLGAIGKLPVDSFQDMLLLGEIALDGCLQPIRGVLPQLRWAEARGMPRAIVPAQNRLEAGLVRRIETLVAEDLEQVVQHLAGAAPLPSAPETTFQSEDAAWASQVDFSMVRGQPEARRGVTLAAAGGHNLLFVGPPGGGKTLLARLLPTIVPPLTFHEALEVTAIHSVAGLVDPERGIVNQRPFRAPHHSVSGVGLVGGGDIPRPGEVSLAHNGVLFLDELAEFQRSALEALRQPLEDGHVCIARARARAEFPARPLVVAAVNPCPCGYRGHPTRACRCTTSQCRNYLTRLSGPLLDRLDLHIAVPPVNVAALTSGKPGESSATVRAAVLEARERQLRRFETQRVSVPTNSQLGLDELELVSPLTKSHQKLLEAAITRFGLSARAYLRLRRAAQTMADLEGESRVHERHLREALQARLLDRQIADW